ncbi:SDR family oxidoreductase [Antrihabitans cavernicola]|uniref:NAD-dependent epimerase/dehydratase family protein n=1 Tax=Antrihabitans cavernicola TaxID=2495913 RepID=A0A5A7S985_9NOCA|nr:NAD(P)H-binding protein [Spelaeibacter cavernicola]KAA0021712.1 NAD-dependent epimerase/dehydratase family protein [Spelaeibacter cavernicola]
MILVTGATGQAGGAVVRGLLDRGLEVRAVASARSAAKVDPRAEVAVADLGDADSVQACLDGVTAAFLHSGYAGIDESQAAMRERGVQRVVLLSSSAVPSGDLTNAVGAYHIRSEQAVRDHGPSWTFLRPYSLMSNTLRWLDQLADGEIVRLPFPDVAVATLHPDDLAAVAAVCLTSDDHTGRAYPVSGPAALRPAEQVEIVAAATGRAMRFDGIPDDQARAQLGKSMPPQYVDAFYRLFVEGDADETTVVPTVRELTGAEPRTLADWATTHASAFALPS